ncbi:SdpI/YhfL protein family protein [Neomoorella glycerini]|uniref:SdpI/YhfL protein family protein n=1 Tax=Neomoorella glycerini TaxID=55779 RepID=A0A6I5ZN55_9FIRM|nr:SdpI family protein [Moorella glycerini]QGP91322.1 SdpI/YhfL protein family protein [Moorella glycerini]
MENKYRVSKEMITRDWPALVVLGAMLVAGILVYPHLPDLVPAHWNFRGEVDNYFSRFWGAFALPLMTGGIYLLMLFIPYLDPKRENYPRFELAYRVVRLGLVFFLAVLHTTVLVVALGGPASLVNRVVPLAVGILFILIGNYLPQARFNYFFGVRTPWTLASEEVWRRTHRFSGYAFILAGFMFVVAAFLPPPANFILGIAGPAIAVGGTIVYSYLALRQVAR